jgi:hypothetical protein
MPFTIVPHTLAARLAGIITPTSRIIPHNPAIESTSYFAHYSCPIYSMSPGNTHMRDWSKEVDKESG